MRNTSILSGSFPLKRKIQEISAVAESSIRFLRSVHSRIFACSPFFPNCHLLFSLYTIQFSAFISSLIYLISLSFSFPCWDHASVADCVLAFPIQSPSLSCIKLNANSIPLSPAFAWPVPSSPCYQPWLLASLTLLIHLVIHTFWTPSSSHPCYSPVLFLESQLLFYSDLSLLNSTWPDTFSFWLCYTPRRTW